MKINTILRSLLALCLVPALGLTGFSQTPKSTYSIMHYHKLKPGHTFAEARAMENEFKKIHQYQADQGLISGWYMLALDLTSNPHKEYDYITINTFSDPGYLDDPYSKATMETVLGADYQAKTSALYKRMDEVKEVAKIEVWETIERATATTLSTPDKAPIWMITNIKVKNNRFDEYMALVKKAKLFYQERVVTGGAVTWNFTGLLFPWANEKPYDFSALNTFPSMKAMMESNSQAEAAFKKSMPGADYKQFVKDLDNLREPARQELYYLIEYALKSSTTQASK